MPKVSEPRPDIRAARHQALVRPGHNCWRVERATRFFCIQDAADYFRLVRYAILQARHTVFSVGWDIQATLDLVPDGATDGAPTRLNELLRWVVRRRPRLRCHILTWDYAALYTLERDPLTRWRLGWRMPRQVRFGFDDHHPLGGSHHQKIVVVDDELAFCGGVDLTGHRWDTASHRVEEPHRLDAIGTPYGPYHEIQAMADGPLAAALGVLVRDRWRALGERTPPPATVAPRGLWPADIEPDMTDVDVAIARTMPPSERNEAIRECEQLFVDSIAAAERSIYIESQYFTNDMLTRALAWRLEEADGPEVIAVVPAECEGWVEKQTMGALRREVLGHLVAADRHRRLRIVYPAASRVHEVPTFVHSKVMIVDDRLVRIGSANLSRRSMGVDSECDLAAHAATTSHRRGVQRIRERLLGEHLGMTPDAVAAESARLGSLRALVDACVERDRTLVRVDIDVPAEAPTDVLRTAADPSEPVDVGSMIGVIPPLDARAARGATRSWLDAIGIATALLVIARTLVDLDAASLWTATAVVLVAHVALVPLELLAVLAGAVLGAVSGGVVAFVGGWMAALVGFFIGRAIGTRRLASWMSRRAYRSARQLGARGILGVAVFRLASIASSGSVNLVCGAAHVPFGRYLIGSAVGMAPMALVLAVIGSLLRAAIDRPGWSNLLIGAAAVLGACGLAFVVRSLLVARQFSPSVRRHRTGAQFG